MPLVPFSSTDTSSSSQRRRNSLLQTFSPSYPTPPLYKRYVLLNQLQNTCTSLRNTLSSLYILKAFEYSSSSAVALTATLSFITRDGAGMLSTLLFSRCAQPFSLKSDTKRWRFLADITCNVALLLEFLSCGKKLSTRKFTAALCLTNSLKACCGCMAASAAGPIDFHWSGSDANNLPELSQKSGAQSTLSSSIGLVLGALLAKLASTPARVKQACAGYLLLTVAHLAANAALLRTVRFTYPNLPRLRLMVRRFQENDGYVMSPEEVAAAEPMLFGGWAKRRTAVGGQEQGEGLWLEGLSLTSSGGVVLELHNGEADDTLCKAWFVALASSSNGSKWTLQTSLEKWEEFKNEARRKGWELENALLKDEGWRHAFPPQEALES